MSQVEKPEAESKALESFEIKDESKGEVEAEVATLGVVDRDRDIIALDAIKDGARVKLSSYGHDILLDGAAPVGKGIIAIEGNKAVFRGKFFLSTTRGREAFETIKALGSDSEWSFGFRVQADDTPSEEQQKMGARRILTKLDAFEVSPVIIGAGIGTRTVAVKEAAPETVVQNISFNVSAIDGAGVAAILEEKAGDIAEIVAVADRLAADEAKVAEEAEAGAERLAAAVGEEFAKFQHTEARRQVEKVEAKHQAEKAEARQLAAAAAVEFDRFQRTQRYLGAA